MLVPPPATTGRLHRDDPAVRAAALLEELVEVRIRQLVEIVHAQRGHARANALTRAADDDTGDLPRIAPVLEGRHQMPEGEIGLPEADEIDERKRAVEGQSHLALAVRASEHDGALGAQLLDPARERERGDVLGERRREADDVIRRPVDAFETPAQESVRPRPRAPDQLELGRRRGGADESLVPVGTGWIGAEQARREHPLAGEELGRGLIREVEVVLLADQPGEGQREVLDVRGDADRGELALEQAQRQGRPRRRPERHVDEEDVQLVARRAAAVTSRPLLRRAAAALRACP